MEIQMTYLGKKVEVKTIQRGEDMKPTGKFTTIVGICMREPGPNKWLDIPLMLVVDRTPVTINSLDEIKILE